MQRAFGLSIPQTLDDVCDPARLALVVYDMHVGIVNQIENGQQIIDRVLRTATTGLSIASTQTKLWLRCQIKRSATLVLQVRYRTTSRITIDRQRRPTRESSFSAPFRTPRQRSPVLGCLRYRSTARFSGCRTAEVRSRESQCPS